MRVENHLRRDPRIATADDHDRRGLAASCELAIALALRRHATSEEITIAFDEPGRKFRRHRWPVAKPNLVDSPIRRRCTSILFPAILGLHLDKRATLVKDVSVLSSRWGAMKHEASRACSHYRLGNVIFGWRCRATI